MPDDPLPWRPLWIAFLIGIPALAIALLCTQFAVMHTGPQFDVELLDNYVVGGAYDRVAALGLATGFGAIGIFSLLNLRTRMRDWRQNASVRHLR